MSTETTERKPALEILLLNDLLTSGVIDEKIHSLAIERVQKELRDTKLAESA